MYKYRKKKSFQIVVWLFLIIMPIECVAVVLISYFIQMKLHKEQNEIKEF